MTPFYNLRLVRTGERFALALSRLGAPETPVATLPTQVTEGGSEGIWDEPGPPWATNLEIRFPWPGVPTVTVVIRIN